MTKEEKEQILNKKTRRELAAMIGIAYMNMCGEDKEAGKRVMRGYLYGCGAVRPHRKDDMIKIIFYYEEEGAIKIV